MPLRVSLLSLILFNAIGHASPFAPEHLPQEADPTISVIDGDTLENDGKIIQLYGIDAPELGQTCQRGGHGWACGVSAAYALHKIVDLGRPSITCSRWNSAGAGQTFKASAIRICKIGQKDIAESLLYEGYAVALPDSFPDYIKAESAAKKAGLGMWGGDFVLPREWRYGKRMSGAPVSAKSCNVKGIVNADGERNYFVPTDEKYKWIDIDPANGGRMFCSDEEARRKGWKRPRLKVGRRIDK